MKFLHFVQAIDAKRGGGLGLAALELSDWMGKSAHRSTLVTTGVNETNTPQLIIGKAEGPSKFFFSRKLRASARQLVESCDQVQGHGFYTYLNWLFGSEARKLGRPLVYHIQGIFDPYILKRSRRKKQIVGHLFENANFKYVSLWRALTVKEADQARRLGITAPIEVLPNGVDTDALRVSERDALRNNWFASNGRKVMLFLGRLHEKKGLDLLIHAIAKNADQFREWLLVIVGPDENNQRQHLESLVASLNLQDHVRFHGPVDRSTKPRALANADAFVLTSHSEGMPVAVLEAAAFGLPLLISTECNLPEFESDGGAIVCLPSEDAVSRSLSSFLSMSDEELHERGKRARELMLSKFTWPQIASHWLQVCESLTKLPGSH